MLRHLAEEVQRKKQLDNAFKHQNSWYNSGCEPIADQRCKLHVGGMVSVVDQQSSQLIMLTCMFTYISSYRYLNAM